MLKPNTYKGGFDEGYALAIRHAKQAAIQVAEEHRAADNYHPDRAAIADEVSAKIARLGYR